MPCSRVVLLVQLMIISLIINSAASESYSSMIRSHRKAAYAAFFVALLWYNLEGMQQPLPLLFTNFSCSDAKGDTYDQTGAQLQMEG